MDFQMDFSKIFEKKKTNSKGKKEAGNSTYA